MSGNDGSRRKASAVPAEGFDVLMPEHIERQLATILIGSTNVARAVLSVMRKRRSGAHLSRSARARESAGSASNSGQSLPSGSALQRATIASSQGGPNNECAEDRNVGFIVRLAAATRHHERIHLRPEHSADWHATRV